MATAQLAISRPSRPVGTWLPNLLIVAFVGSLLGAIWFPDSNAATWMVALAVAAMSLRVRPDREFFTPALFECWRSWRVWWDALQITLLMLGLLVVFGAVLGTWDGRMLTMFSGRTATDWIVVKLPTVFLQQWALQILLVPLLQESIGPGRRSVFIGAAVFSLLHLPNPLLMLLTFIAGFFWSECYQRGRQLVPIVASHLILAIVAAAFCGEYAFSMRVGPKCLELLPRPVAGLTHDGTSFFRLPYCVDGEVERMTQECDIVRLSGWVVDPIHGRRPKGFFLECHGQWQRIEGHLCEDAQAEHATARAGDVFSFELSVSTELLRPGEESVVWVETARGWLEPLRAAGRIAPAATLPPGYSLVHFPLEKHLLIDRVAHMPGSMALAGHTDDQALASGYQFAVMSTDGDRDAVIRPLDVNHVFDARKSGRFSLQLKTRDEAAGLPLLYVLGASGELRRVRMDPSCQEVSVKHGPLAGLFPFEP